MLGRFTYKQKYAFSIVLITFMLFVVYELAIAETIKLSNENKMLKSEIAKQKQINERIVILKHQLKIENDNNIEEKKDFQQFLLNQMVLLSHKYNVKIVEIPKEHIYIDNDIQVETYIITIEGSYKSNTETLNALLKNVFPGQIVSINYKVVDVFRTKSRKLLTTFYIQRIKNTTSNENNR